MKRLFLIFTLLICSVSYGQRCVGNCTNGQGTYYHSNGQTYVGSWKDDVYHGQGTYTWPGGQKYVGSFRAGKRNGQGTHSWPGGKTYVGSWRAGDYQEGTINGQGTYTYLDGIKDVGEFRNGKLNGFAIRFDKNGNVLKEGIWKDDEFQYAKKQPTNSSNSLTKLNKYIEFCKEIGFTFGTEKFGECVLKAMEVE